MSRLFPRSIRTLAAVAAVGFALVGCGGPTPIATPESTAPAAPVAFAAMPQNSIEYGGIEYGREDYRGTPAPGPLVLGGVRYRLAHSAHPRPGYVQRAYLPAGQRLASYRRMVLVEAVTGASVSEAVRSQVEMLQRRKVTDPLVNLDLRTNARTGEAVLDFTMAGRAADGREFVEWNAYRYVPVNQGGIRGVQLYGLSLRAYGTDRLAFARSLTETRQHGIATVSTAPVPPVELRKW